MQFRVGGKRGKMVLAHRWAYQQFVGPIPPGLHIDHLCSIRHCMYPPHLEAVTPRENTLRSIARKRERELVATRG